MDHGENVPPHKIEKILVERDLVIMISNDLKWEEQINKATNAAKAIIAQISNIFTYFDAELVRLLYVCLIRHLKKEIEKLENVQHRATILVPSIKKKSYEDKLKILKLTTLEIRRKMGDLIEFYKILNGLDKVKWRNRLVDQGNNDEPARR